MCCPETLKFVNPYLLKSDIMKEPLEFSTLGKPLEQLTYGELET